VTDPEQLRASRARLAARALADRRRFERALHDGVQQDLIALSVRLQLLDAAGADELRAELHGALDRVRAVAADLYPPLLDARGLVDSLRTLAPVESESFGPEPPRETAAAIYFACRAAVEEGGAAAFRLRRRGAELLVELDGSVELPQHARDLAEAAGGSVSADGTRTTVAFPVSS